MLTNDNLSPAALAAVDWAETIPAGFPITAHPDFDKHFGDLLADDLNDALDELERRAEEHRFHAIDLRNLVRDRNEVGTMTDNFKPPLSPVGSPEFDQQQNDAAMKRANELIDWVLARPSIRHPFRSAEFRRAFPDVTPADVRLALAEVARIAGK